jgi:hypothetical protein
VSFSAKVKKMARGQNASNRPDLSFWIFIACCALGAVTFISLLLSGEIQGERVATNIEHQLK